jgi:hypothetical protein
MGERFDIYNSESLKDKAQTLPWLRQVERCETQVSNRQAYNQEGCCEMKTVDEILREMRKMGENYSISESNDCRYVAYWLGTTFADRIEAAVKNQFRDTTKTMPEVAVADSATTNPTSKDSLEVGNEAALREALENSNGLIEELAPFGEWYESAWEQIKENNAALSAPPRNCDKCLTPKDAMLAHLEEVYEGEKVEFGDYEWCEFVKWLFAETKGETNEQ